MMIGGQYNVLLITDVHYTVIYEHEQVLTQGSRWHMANPLPVHALSQLDVEV